MFMLIFLPTNIKIFTLILIFFKGEENNYFLQNCLNNGKNSKGEVALLIIKTFVITTTTKRPIPSKNR